MELKKMLERVKELEKLAEKIKTQINEVLDTGRGSK